MDRNLIAPSPDHLWQVRSLLDARQPGELELLKLCQRRIILSRETAYHPHPEPLEWRTQQLGMVG